MILWSEVEIAPILNFFIMLCFINIIILLNNFWLGDKSKSESITEPNLTSVITSSLLPQKWFIPYLTNYKLFIQPVKNFYLGSCGYIIWSNNFILNINCSILKWRWIGRVRSEWSAISTFKSKGSSERISYKSRKMIAWRELGIDCCQDWSKTSIPYWSIGS